jgi:hypothetical protein
VPVLLGPNAGKALAQRQTQVVLHPPSNCPWVRPTTHPGTGRGYSSCIQQRMIPAATLSGGGQMEQGHPGTGRPFTAGSVLLLANFLARALASERCFYAFLLAGLEVKRVALHFFDNVFLLHFALKAAQSILKGFTLLQSDFRQTDTPPNPSGRTE